MAFVLTLVVTPVIYVCWSVGRDRRTAGAADQAAGGGSLAGSNAQHGGTAMNCPDRRLTARISAPNCWNSMTSMPLASSLSANSASRAAKFAIGELGAAAILSMMGLTVRAGQVSWQIPIFAPNGSAIHPLTAMTRARLFCYFDRGSIRAGHGSWC
ncbi:MAG: hypothetical protein R3D53_08890 [Paracoccaceae bacterium]